MPQYTKTDGTIRITNLKLPAIIGCNDWEQHTRQEIVINIAMNVDITHATATDQLTDTVDYKALKKRIINAVENSSFKLLETFTDHILGLVMESPGVMAATVKTDKPGALRYADSVSVELHAKRS